MCEGRSETATLEFRSGISWEGSRRGSWRRRSLELEETLKFSSWNSSFAATAAAAGEGGVGGGGEMSFGFRGSRGDLETGLHNLMPDRRNSSSSSNMVRGCFFLDYSSRNCLSLFLFFFPSSVFFLCYSLKLFCFSLFLQVWHCSYVLPPYKKKIFSSLRKQTWLLSVIVTLNHKTLCQRSFQICNWEKKHKKRAASENKTSSCNCNIEQQYLCQRSFENLQVMKERNSIRQLHILFCRAVICFWLLLYYLWDFIFRGCSSARDSMALDELSMQVQWLSLWQVLTSTLHYTNTCCKSFQLNDIFN